MDEIFERLNTVFRDFFDDEDIELDEETTAKSRVTVRVAGLSALQERF